MKANDLMVGDYIRTKQGIATVVAVWEKAIYAPVGDNVIFAAVGDEVVELREGEFEEIPLTPWILEKNGFSRNGLDIALFDRKGGDDFVGASNLQCAHELQHALRLFGIEKEIEL